MKRVWNTNSHLLAAERGESGPVKALHQRLKLLELKSDVYGGDIPTVETDGSQRIIRSEHQFAAPEI